jgi:hypothetical protein
MTEQLYDQNYVKSWVKLVSLPWDPSLLFLLVTALG